MQWDGLAGLDPSKSKHLSQSLRALDEQYPEQWKGKMVRYSSLVDTLDTNGLLAEVSSDREQEFFAKFFREIDKVNAQFCQAAKAVISAYRRRRSVGTGLGWLYRKFRGSGAGSNSVPVDELSQEQLAMHTQICLEYARLNAEVLRRLAEAHDEMYGNGHGRIILDSMWKTHSGIANFLHSPLLSELEAVAESFPAGSGLEKGQGGQCKLEHCSSDDLRSQDPSREGESLQCPICLDVLYKPVGLACGHKFCAPCVLRAAQPRCAIKPGQEDAALAAVPHRAKCPQCRQRCVFKTASMLTVLSSNLEAKFPQYWKEREKEEREERRKSKQAIMRQLEARGLAYPNVFLYM